MCQWYLAPCARVNLLCFFLLLHPATTEICTTSVCQEASSHILNTIDVSVDPCDDFYRFACGGLFRKSLPGKSLIALAEEEVDSQIRAMLEEPVEPTEQKAIQSLKGFFTSCMDEAAIEQNGLGRFEEALQEIGGWPVVQGSKWREIDFNVEDLLIKLRILGLEYSQLFYFSISSFDANTISISTPITSLVKRKNKRRYRHFATAVAVALGADYQGISTEIQMMLQFETKLYNIAYRRTKFRKTTFRNIQERYPFINLLKLANGIFHDTTFSYNDRAYFPSTNYLRDLNELFKETSIRTISNYIIWKAVESVIPYLPKTFRNLKISYDASVSKKFAEEEKNRFIVCKWASMMILPPTLETMYFKKYFSLERKTEIDKFVWLIRDQLTNLLNNTGLYDGISRKRALAKAKAVTHLVGGSDELFHEEYLSQVFYENKIMNFNDCLSIALALNQQRNNYRLKLNNTLEDVYSSYITVNAYYNSFSKSLVIPAATLQQLYFNKHRPQYMNFGTLGMLVGHELTHAFGKNANEDDNMWTKAAVNKFRQKSQCIIQKANSFDIEGSNLHINGQKTLEENVCDFTGAEIAYQAYQNWVKINGEGELLPGLGYRPPQLFWISAANFFCSTVAPEKLQQMIDEDPHAHPAFRVFGTMSNNRHFGSDFKCPIGSRMNPTRKCHIF